MRKGRIRRDVRWCITIMAAASWHQREDIADHLAHTFGSAKWEIFGHSCTTPWSSAWKGGRRDYLSAWLLPIFYFSLVKVCTRGVNSPVLLSCISWPLQWPLRKPDLIPWGVLPHLSWKLQEMPRLKGSSGVAWLYVPSQGGSPSLPGSNWLVPNWLRSIHLPQRQLGWSKQLRVSETGAAKGVRWS